MALGTSYDDLLSPSRPSGLGQPSYMRIRRQAPDPNAPQDPAATPTPAAATTADPFSDPTPAPAPPPMGMSTSWDPATPNTPRPRHAWGGQPADGTAQPGLTGDQGQLDGIRANVQKLQTTTDPTARAALHDQVSRDIATSLKAAGHDVKWSGAQLVVDGRTYNVAGGDPSAPDANQTARANQGTRDQQLSGDQRTAGAPQPPSGHRDGDVAEYLRKLMQGGMAPQAAIDKANADLGLQSGSSPMYDPRSNTIGMPSMYLDGQSGWGNVVRAPSRPSVASMSGAPASAGGASGVNLSLGSFDLPNVGSAPSSADAGTPAIGSVAGPNWVALGAGGPDFIAIGNGGWVPPNHPLAEQARQQAAAAPPPANADPQLPNAPASNRFATTAPTYTPGDVPMDDLEGYDVNSTLDKMGARTALTPEQLKTSYEAGHVNDRLDGYDLASLIQRLPASSTLPQLNESYAQGHVDTPTPDAYHAGTLDDPQHLGLGAIGDKTAAGVSSLLDHPDSLDPRTVEMMKAKSKEELAATQQQEDESLQGFGAASGISDSKWLASERAASLRSRDEAIIGKNRDIEIQAATQNKADERAALGLGSDVSSAQASSQRADAALTLQKQLEQEGLNKDQVNSEMAKAGFARESQVINEQLRGEAFTKQNDATQQNIQNLLAKEAGQRSATDIATSKNLQAASYEQQGQVANAGIASKQFEDQNAAVQQNISNLFKSREDQASAVSLANDTSLKAATLKGDRMALRESINQKAAELGQSADKLQLDYTLGLLSTAMQKYGIDTGAATARRGQDIDAATAAAGQGVQKYGIDVGASLDREKLAQAGREFQEDLAYRLQALNQANDQFQASFGLNSWEAADASNLSWFKEGTSGASA